jgi:hypothetical protein
MHESAVMSFILQGMHGSLRKPELVELGAQCKRWYVAMFGAFALWMLVHGIFGGGIFLSCP